MLVLSRERDQSIMVGDDIEVFVVDIRGNKVSLGINAPKDVSVHRKEIYDVIRREQRTAPLFEQQQQVTLQAGGVGVVPTPTPLPSAPPACPSDPPPSHPHNPHGKKARKAGRKAGQGQ